MLCNFLLGHVPTEEVSDVHLSEQERHFDSR
jgi:hypothetical protein